MQWIGLSHDIGMWRAVGIAAMQLRVPQNEGSFLTAFSRMALLHGVSYLVGSLERAVSGRDSDRYH